MTSIPRFDASLPALAVRLREGALDVTALAEAACDAIDAVNPELLAVLPEPGRRDRLRADAAALTARYPAPDARPALFGVPVLVKDVIRVDGFETHAGSALPSALFAGPEAEVVARLRAAGALILGKAVTTEFAYFESGPTRNPRARGHTPGGSSSGSAAAVAAGLAPLALGTQTVGSVIRPGAFCGVAAFKPSYGRVPSDGVVYYAPSVDTVGWFARDAAGLVEAARVLLDGWRDVHAPARPLRVAAPDGPYLERVEPAALEVFAQTLERLAGAGVEVYRLPALADIDGVVRRHRWLTSFEFARQHDRWYGEYGPLYRPRSSLLVEEGRALTEAQHAAGLASGLALREELSGLLDAHDLDVWVSPAAPGPAPEGLGSTGDPVMNAPWTHAGLPALTLPAGDVTGLPLGLQIAGRYGGDEALLAVAGALETLLA